MLEALLSTEQVIQVLEGMSLKRNHHTLLVGTAIIDNNIEVPQKTKNWSTIWSSNLSTGHLPQRLENSYLKRYLDTDVHSSIIQGGHDMEATEVS